MEQFEERVALYKAHELVRRHKHSVLMFTTGSAKQEKYEAMMANIESMMSE